MGGLMAYQQLGRDMLTATVKWYDKTKGYGFLTVDDGSELFVHSSALPTDVRILNAGDVVECEAQVGNKGPQASVARVVMPAPLEAEGIMRPKADLVSAVDEVTNSLQAISAVLRSGGQPGRAECYNVARALRVLANRLNPAAS
ncbi:cold-shock protein [Micromonospora sp. 4G55]|uniref:cold-shock protein n=1 Tax=Micromonospora sp. 4G55 TaxID=2806102 RepID=UPI001A4A554F|nr:cold shock domain-containing protein [Micromonospora sp. 4G55]MBM0256063.1 cold-shock protein [Micromonospora sp. 4G55]